MSFAGYLGLAYGMLTQSIKAINLTPRRHTSVPPSAILTPCPRTDLIPLSAKLCRHLHFISESELDEAAIMMLNTIWCLK